MTANIFIQAIKAWYFLFDFTTVSITVRFSLRPSLSDAKFSIRIRSTNSIKYLQYLSPINFLIHNNFIDCCTSGHPSIMA